MERKIEDAVLAVIATHADIVDVVGAGAVLVRAYDNTKRVAERGIVVRCDAPVNANLGAQGGGAYWSCVVYGLVGQVTDNTTTQDLADRAHGACQRAFAALTAGALTTALTSGGITVHGVVGDVPADSEMDEERGVLKRSSAVRLHFSVA
jgi:hypothetical protein